MAINKYAKKILIIREYVHANAQVKRRIETGNVKNEKKTKLSWRNTLSPTKGK